MPIIYAINPTKKRKTKPVNRKRAVAKRKVTKKPKTKKKKSTFKTIAKETTVKTVARRNKGGSQMARKKRSRKRRRRNPRRRNTVVRYRDNTIGGINFSSVFKSTIAMGFGAIAGKFTAKRFAEGGGDKENWNWKNYLLCLGGGFVAAQFTRVFLKSSTKANEVMKGSALLAFYKFLVDEIAPKSESLDAWFGEEELTPYGNYGESFNPYADGYGDIYQGGETDWIQGVDGAWRPVDESHRLPETSGYGDILVEPEGRYGDVLAPVDSRYGALGGGAGPDVFERDRM